VVEGSRILSKKQRKNFKLKKKQYHAMFINFWEIMTGWRKVYNGEIHRLQTHVYKIDYEVWIS
jgi:hypothetical protein